MSQKMDGSLVPVVEPATDVTGGGREEVISRGKGYMSNPTVTRPANQTPYSAGDVIGGVVTLTDMGPAGGDILITDIDLMYNVAALPSGMTGVRAHLYSETPPSAYADNAVWDLPSGDRSVYLGYMDFGTPVDLGGTLFVQPSPQVVKKLRMGATTSLFAYYVTAAGFTPAANSETLVGRFNAVGA
jgi:hypothetical protein